MIHKTQMSVTPNANIELEKLGIAVNDSDEWVNFNIILSKVEGYRERYDNDVLKPNECTVYLSSGGYAINTPYKQFDQIMQNVNT